VNVIGVDPGMTGAICLLTAIGVEVADMPVVDKQVNAHELARIIGLMKEDAGRLQVAAVEQVHSMPGQGVASTFKFGRGYGIVLLPIIHVPPTLWCKAFNLTSDKEGHRARAIDLWPAQAHLFARKKDDGRADAALIALWASQQQPAAVAS